MPMGHVIVHVDETWNGAPVSDADRNALAPFVQDAEPEITTVRVIPRARPQADAARALAKAQRARPGRRPAPPSSPSSAVRGGGANPPRPSTWAMRWPRGPPDGHPPL